MRRTTVRIATLTTLAGCLALTACAPGASTDTATSGATTGASAAAVKTDAASLGNVTLTVWDQEVRGGQAKQITQLNDAFGKKYPNIKINRVSRSFDDLGKTLKLALSGDTPPDVAEVNNGRADMGAYVKAGQLLALDGYAKAYNWDARYPQSVRQYSSYTTDGKTFGTGSLYGLPQVGEVVGIFVNTKNLNDAGVPMPKTWADFEASLQTLKDKRSEAPLVLGNLDKWPAIHVFGPVQAQYVAPDTVRKLAFGQSGASWTTDDNTKAAQTIVDWVDKGYLDKSANGLAYDPAWQAFSKGKGTYLMGGTWLAADLAAAMKENVSFILPPPSAAAGDKVVSTGGTGIPWGISAKSKNPDAAAAYINFITSPEAMKVLAETDNLPVADTAQQTASTPLGKQVFEAFGSIVKADGLVPYLDYATPTMSDTIGASLQDLIAKQKTPAQFLEALQKDYSAFTAKNG